MKYSIYAVCCSFCLIYLLLASAPVQGQEFSVLKGQVNDSKAHFTINESFPIVGQSFMANQTGYVTEIAILPKNNARSNSTTTTLNFWIGPNPGERNIFTGKPRQQITFSGDRNNGQLVYFQLDQPFPVVKGKMYRFQLGKRSQDEIELQLAGSFKNSYPNGAIYFYDGSTRYKRDLTFSVRISSKKNSIALVE